MVFPAAKQQGAARYPQAHKINTDAARLQCSPNPAGGNTLHICTPYTSDAVRNVVELYDAQGRLMTTFVLSADNSCADFSIAALPSGIYWAAWKQDGHLTQSTQWIKL
ncbi:MAG: T9SS type A sorting domain-containing protein [Sphingobacteriales bacterium]|nr:T9SS type A sorting domain-containing protein [Sphingobacteriales bacterium]